MKRALLWGWVGLSFALTAVGLEAQAAQYVNIGTGGVTGVYYPAGGAICRMVNKTRKEHGVRCGVESTGGSVYNINALAAGELELGVAQADLTYKAAQGEKPFTAEHGKKIRAVMALHPEVVTLVSRASAEINGVADLVGKRVNVGSPGSGNERSANELLAACNIRTEQLALAGRLKPAEMPDALRDDKLDAYFYVVGHPTANVKDVAASVQIHLTPLTGACVDKMVTSHPYLVKTEIPGGMYQGVDKPTTSYGVKALLVASSDAPDEAIYQVVKAVFENLERFTRLHPAFRALTPENMLQGLTAPLHPGAARYYKEKGWKTP